MAGSVISTTGPSARPAMTHTPAAASTASAKTTAMVRMRVIVRTAARKSTRILPPTPRDARLSHSADELLSKHLPTRLISFSIILARCHLSLRSARICQIDNKKGRQGQPMVSNERVLSLDWAPDAIVVTGLDGSILHVNPRAEDLFGYRKEELAEKPLELVIPEGLASVTLESSPLQHVSRAVICAHRDGTRFPGTARWRPAPTGRSELVVFSVRSLESP